MEANQQLQKMTSKALFSRDDVKKKFEEMLGKRAPSFITSVLQIVSQNKLLANADPNSVYQAAAVAATLDLPLNNNLGFAYIVPYNTKHADGSYGQVAQFQMGYKGFIQLAQRSGQFKTISSTPIYEGQLVKQNPLTGFEFDFETPVKKDAQVIGYAAYFELINGFQKTLYMSVENIRKHGDKYSKTFKKGLWQDDFDAMANKTVIKLLLSKFAPLSIEMQTATIVDQSVINDSETLDVDYVDHREPEPEPASNKEHERLEKMIHSATTEKQLRAIKPHVEGEAPALLDLFNEKELSLKTKETA